MFKTLPTNGKDKSRNNNELTLKSTSHPRLDYTAREEGQSSTEPHLKHYLGLYDPKTGELELIEAKKMVIRATVREDEEMEDEPADVKPVSDINPTQPDTSKKTMSLLLTMCSQ